MTNRENFTLEELLESDHYDYISLKYSPHYQKLVHAIEIVKEFIRKKKLVIYGGTAIDFALRLRGDAIYSDESLTIPDLDFFSPDSVKHAYELADILYDVGYTDVRVVRALHVGTMKVDLTNYNDWIADISHCPEEVFKNLPTLDYGGLRIINPWFQRLDMHSSLSHPYDNPPIEVIFQRWEKDLKRFNKLDKYYPVETKAEGWKMITREIELNNIPPNALIAGFAGIALIKNKYRISGRSEKSYKLIYDEPENTKNKHILELFSDNPQREIEFYKHSSHEKGKEYTHYSQYFNLLPSSYHIDLGYLYVVIYDISFRPVSFVKNNEFNVLSAQGILKILMAHALMNPNSNIKLYDSQLMFYHYGDFLNYVKTSESNDLTRLSIDVYGNKNYSVGMQINLSTIYHEYDNNIVDETKTLPHNYYPDRRRGQGLSAPEYNYDSVYYKMSGEKLN